MDNPLYNLQSNYLKLIIFTIQFLGCFQMIVPIEIAALHCHVRQTASSGSWVFSGVVGASPRVWQKRPEIMVELVGFDGIFMDNPLFI